MIQLKKNIGINREYTISILVLSLAGLYFILTSFFKGDIKEKRIDYHSKNDFLIADNQIGFASIILPKENTPFMKEAANDLAIYIEKISGAKIEIIEGAPLKIPAKAIWVGYQPVLDKLFPSVKFEYNYPEEVINVANENHIAITGRDKWDPKNMSIPDRTGKKIITGIQLEYGTCNAIYTFIQDQLGVRWFWPGESGEDIIKTERLSIKPFAYRYHPEIRDRSGILQLTRIISNKGGIEEYKWARLQRMQLSSLTLSTNHAFTSWWAKYGAIYPEYFAMLQNGKREPQYGPADVKLCQSNPDVWEQWMKEVEDQLKINPNATIFSAAANDGWSQGHCTCSKCRAWDSPGFSWSKPVLSDREVTFANALAKKLKSKYPGKPYKVLIMGYGYTRPAPSMAKPDENVMVLSVSNFLQRGDGFEDDRTLSIKQYADWAEVTNNLAWRPNIGNPAGQVVGMPDISPHQTAEDFKFIAKKGCLGLFFDSYWNHWSTQSIQYYCMAQLAWNPHLNIDSLLNDYYARAYGPAATDMKKYWQLMENTRNELIDKVKTRERFLRSPEIYTKNWFNNAQSILKIAKSKTENTKYAERINFAASGLEFSELVIETRILNQKWEKNKSDQDIIKLIEANWTKAKDMKARFHKYAINFNRSFGNPTASGMSGLHPKNPVNDKTLRRTDKIPGYE
jgi:hypothetical protein